MAPTNKNGARIALVLHAHLPWVRHLEHEFFFEERWFFEALTSCYAPLLRMLRRLAEDDIPFTPALSISPPLQNMMEDPLLEWRYRRHLTESLALAEREIRRWNNDTRQREAEAYGARGREHAEWFDGQGGFAGLRSGFQALAAAGRVEPLATAATHGYLPALRIEPANIRAQIHIGRNEARRLWGVAPTGFWLPECGFFPGLEHDMAAAGAHYFFTSETARAPGANPRRPGVCRNGVRHFARDAAGAARVWDAAGGYPGDPAYREFHRDIGYDAPPEALGPYWLPPEGRAPTGFKYYRVTDRRGAGEKQLYDPARARARVAEHARDFLENLRARAAAAPGRGPPVFTLPFDAELFGHWWAEGVDWLDATARLAAAEYPELRWATPGAAAGEIRPARGAPRESSWGWRGFHEHWINERTDWIWRAAADAGRALRARAAEVPADDFTRRARRQLAREALLAQASDWAFLIHNRTAAAFAEKTVRDALARFDYLSRRLERGALGEAELAAAEKANALFPAPDVAVWGDGI